MGEEVKVEAWGQSLKQKIINIEIVRQTSLMSEASSLRKVVVRSRDGRVIPGFTRQELMNDSVKIITQKGKEQIFDVEKLKAVFFVRDFQGNPEYDEVRFLNKQSANPMIWVRIEFFDGEVLEGKIRNNIELLGSPGFFLWPSDQDANNECVYVIKSSLKNFTILYPA